ncbi:MAG: DUF4410 domain-containing protein [Opitutaceae bacterium]
MTHQSVFSPTRIAVGILGLLLLPGCASVSVDTEKDLVGTARLAPPSIIYVKRFDTTNGNWEGPVAGESARARIAAELAENIESRLTEVVPARILYEESDQPTDGWLVTGEFLRVNPGGKWTRMMIGLGAGGSKFETKVRVFDLTRSATDPIMVFNTTGGSNLEGGSATFNDATDDDIDRTAREIRDLMQEKYRVLSGQST